MRKPNQDVERVDKAFQQARSELGRIGSSRDEIMRRIATTSIRNPQKMHFAYAIGTFGLLALIALFLSHSTNTSPLPRAAEESSLGIGDAQLTEYIAAILDHNAVVVIWSFRGSGVMAMPANSADCPAGMYRLSTLRQIKLADGRTIVCSLLIPNAGIEPVLQPPSIYARSDDSNIIAMSVSPRTASALDLADAIRSAGADGNAGIAVPEIFQQIQKHTH